MNHLRDDVQSGGGAAVARRAPSRRHCEISMDQLPCPKHTQTPCVACGGTGDPKVEQLARARFGRLQAQLTECTWCDGSGVRTILYVECGCPTVQQRVGFDLPWANSSA